MTEAEDRANTPEQKARDLLERLSDCTNYTDPQRLSSGDIVELANLYARIDQLSAAVTNDDDRVECGYFAMHYVGLGPLPNCDRCFKPYSEHLIGKAFPIPRTHTNTVRVMTPEEVDRKIEQVLGTKSALHAPPGFAPQILSGCAVRAEMQKDDATARVSQITPAEHAPDKNHRLIRFVYAETTEGGMETHEMSDARELSNLHAWMRRDVAREDQALLEWAEQRAAVGEYREHRLGILFRVGTQR